MVNKKNMILITLSIIMLLFTIQGALAQESGVYTIDYEDTLESDGLTQIDIGKSAMTHLRDDYYGLVYEDLTNTQIRLRIIEMGEDETVTNSTELYIKDDYVYDQVYETSSTVRSTSKLKILSFDKELGVGIISYVKASDNVMEIKGFSLYENGTVNLGSTVYTGRTDHRDVDIRKTGNDTFLYVATRAGSSSGRYVATGATIGSTGIISSDDELVYYGATGLANDAEVNLIKKGNNCQMFFKDNTASLVRHSHTCSNTSFSGGTTYINDRAEKTNIPVEGNVVDMVDAHYNEDNGLIYLSYTETIDNYGVLAFYDDSMNLLNKERYLDNTSLKDQEMIIGNEGNAVLAYTENANNILQVMTQVVDSYGNIELGHHADEYAYGYNSNLYKVYNTSNNYILSNRHDDGVNTYGTYATMGIGVLPPPSPADTSVSLLDENTLEAYNMDNKTLTFYAHCEDNINYQEEITSGTQGISVDCNYESFSIQVQSNITPDYVYTRKYLRDLEGQDQFDLDVYLIDPHETSYIDNEIQIDDMTGTYTNAKLYFNKNINGQNTQITASGLDLKNTMRAVLMHDQEYYVYLESDETGLNYLGKYQSPATSEGFYKKSVIHLFDITLTPTINNIVNLVEYQLEVDEDTKQVTYYAKTPDGADPSIINMDVKIYNGSTTTGTLIHDEFYGLETYSHSTLYTFLSGTENLTEYENDTLNAEMRIEFIDDGQIRVKKFETTLWANRELTLPIEEHLGEGVLDWFLVILLGTIALFATIKSANIAAIGIIGLASLFVIFGWFTLSAGTLALAALVSFVSWINSNRGEEQ